MGCSSCCHFGKKTSFISMICLTAIFFIIEITVGYVTNSMALVADSFHMLSDVVSLVVGLVAFRYSKVGRPTSTYTFGYARAGVLGALVNVVFLIALCFSIAVEALKRLVKTEHLDNPMWVLITGGAGLLVNVIGLILFRQHGHGHSHGSSSTNSNHHHHHHGSNGNHHVENDSEKVISQPLIADDEDDTKNSTKPESSDGISKEHHAVNDVFVDVKDGDKHSATQLNLRGVYLHVLGDALGSIIVMFSASILMTVKEDWTLYVDPAMSLLMVIVILKTSIPLLRESSMILMQTVPTHIKLQEIQDRLVEKIPSVIGIHEFHIWQLAGNKIIASAHVRCHSLPEYMSLANQLKEFFHEEGIHSTTIQPEFVDTITRNLTNENEDVSEACALECDVDCYEKTCCGQSPPSSPNRSDDDDILVL